MRLAPAAAAFLALLPLAGQDKESATYRILVADKEIGTELVEIERGAGRILVRSTVKLREQTKEGVVERIHRSELEADAKTLVPVRYVVRGRGPGGDSEFVFQFEGAKIRLTGTVAGKPAAPQEARRTATAILFDTVSVGQTVALLKALRPEAGGKRKLRATIPANLSEGDLRVEDRGEANLVGAGRVEPARAYLITLDPVGLAAYVDKEGRLLLLRNPFTNTRVVLDGYQEFAVGRRAAPQVPAGAEETVVRIQSGNLELVGSLVQPKAQAKRAPAVLILGGPGPVDRDGNTSDLRFDLYRTVAYALAEAGFAVLRYDKRGVGQSGGNLSLATLNDFVGDAEAALGALAKAASVDPEALSIVGHSEGGVIGGILATREPKLKSLALLASPAQPLDELLLRQYRETARARGVAPEDIERETEARRKHFAQIKASKEDWLEIGGAKVFVGWLREHFNHDVVATLKRVKAAVIVAQGNRDRVVFPDNADVVDRALKEAAHPRFEMMKFEKLDHLFVESEEGAIARLAEERPVDRGFVEYLVDALRRHGKK